MHECSNADIEGVPSLESAEPHDTLGSTEGLCLEITHKCMYTTCTRPLHEDGSTSQHKSAVGALMVHHPVWMSHHTSGSRQDNPTVHWGG